VKDKLIPYIIIAVIIFLSTFLLGYSNKEAVPITLYRVYLEGNSIGYITSKDKLDDYINEKEKKIKEKYDIEKIYFPEGIVIREEITFGKKVLTTEEMYNKIIETNNFAIEAYEITIKPLAEGKKEKKIYTLDMEYFEEALETTIKVFAGTDDYIAFDKDQQKKIVEYGYQIEDIYVKETENDLISFQKKNIDVDKLIITSSEDMTRYILYGTLKEQEKYIIKEGDTLRSIALSNKLSPEEFLIANPKFLNMDNLIVPKEEVYIGLIDPQVTIVVEKYVIEEKEDNFHTDIVYDSTLYKGFDYYRVKGENGLNKVYEKVRYENGYISNVQIENNEVLKPTINAVYVKGQKVAPSVGDPSNWTWPTAKPYVITSPYGPRWGRIHQAVDIVGGKGYGSPIYAANNGTVISAKYSYTGGNAITINHNNGYYTYYCHLSKILVSKGDVVPAGFVIGLMGHTGHNSKTGLPVGTHLHFGIWKGPPYGHKSTSINPMLMY